MAVYIGHEECQVIYVARNGQQLLVSSVWVGDQQVFPPSGQGGFILRVGVTSGYAYAPLREWAVEIGQTHQTITEITVPMEAVGPSLQSLFENCQALTSVPDMDTSQVTTMGYMFYNCWALTTVPALDTSQVTNMGYMFSGCRVLTTVPALDTSQVTNMGYMFSGCWVLTTVPALDTSQVTNMRNMFYDCRALTTVPALDTSQVTSMSAMFTGCSSLTSVPALDTSQVTDAKWMFNSCTSLESVTLPGMGNGFTTTQDLNMKATKLNAAAANALMQSLGTPPPGGTLQLPATAAGANTSIATAKNWTVTVG